MAVLLWSDIRSSKTVARDFMASCGFKTATDLRLCKGCNVFTAIAKRINWFNLSMILGQFTGENVERPKSALRSAAWGSGQVFYLGSSNALLLTKRFQICAK